MIELTPREIVAELDRYIVGQNEAKKSVAVAMRKHAQLNDNAVMRGKPMTIEDYLASPMITARCSSKLASSGCRLRARLMPMVSGPEISSSLSPL